MPSPSSSKRKKNKQTGDGLRPEQLWKEGTAQQAGAAYGGPGDGAPGQFPVGPSVRASGRRRRLQPGLVFFFVFMVCQCAERGR